jgi:hypothetical protein
VYKAFIVTTTKKKKKKEEEKRKKEKEKEEYNCFLIPYASFDLQNRPLE